MKKMACFAVAAAMILSTFSYALADNYTDYYKDLSGGINGKQKVLRDLPKMRYTH